MDNIDIALEILKILNDNNFDGYIVGGFVRDYILNINSNDIDLTSNATPEEVSKLFKTIPTGIKYGTVLISYKNHTFEHTTFRSDGSYNDLRHPNSINYSNDVKVDILRRDFTINSLLMDKDKNIIDYLDGTSDLKKKIIKTIGDPKTRFNEDALRMLRAISFVSKLGFKLDNDTYNSIKENKELLRNVSVERIRIEFDKISNGKNRKKAWELFYELKLNELFPNMLELNDYDVSFNDILINSLLKNVKISDFWLISKSNIKALEKAQNIIKEGLSDYNLFMAGFTSSKYALDYLKLDIKLYENLLIKSIKDLDINGSDLIDIVEKNKRNDCLNHLAKMVLEKKIKNKKTILLKEVYRWITLQ